tara:strand:- start:589 stop:1743 length:1155 start_codon:yes stop_codon:yes gene_type:complete
MYKNFLTNQYLKDKKNLIKHNYLSEQFRDYKKIFSKIEKVIKFNDFTLGFEVEKFENNFKKLMNSKFCVGVGSGTDAIYLSLKMLDLKAGSEIITTPYTFYATINAIAQANCVPKFVDSKEDFNINPDLIEEKITKKTKAILVVHWSGRICDMEKINKIAKKYNLFVIEDACHAALSTLNGKYAGNFGDLGCFSLHPLKNLNVWGDGGMILTNNPKFEKKLRLLRNHGLKNRNEIEIFGVNSRLDTIQAVVANHLIKKLNKITTARRKNAFYLDKKLKSIKYIKIPQRDKKLKEVFHIYSIQTRYRDELSRYLNKNKIDAKQHYPIPMHLQKPLRKLGYKKGDFPVSEKLAKTTLSLPVHEFIDKRKLDFMIKKIKLFYENYSK